MRKELKHFGVLGMRWGRRKAQDSGPSGSTKRLAKKDAQRFIDAKMFYGKTAGTRRKLLNAELNKKKKEIPGYEEEFNKNLGQVDAARSAKKAINERNRIDNIAKARSFVKNILGITGSLSVGVATTVYFANKQKIDSYVVDQFNKIREGKVNVPIWVPNWPKK